jgi:dihydroflavonol-4-reductase
VGANLVRALLARDWSVRALVRGASPSLDGLKIDLVRGDLFVPGLSDAMRGSDAVFHVAATYSLWQRDRAEVMRANVEGTRLVLGAARRAGVPRVVHTSSVADRGI